MNLPNGITLLRILLVPFFFTELVSYEKGLHHHRMSALVIFLIASGTDLLDGFLARLMKSRTELGRFLDPLADKLLLLSGFLGILLVGALPYKPPIWITVAIVFRDIVIVSGLILIYLMNSTVKIQPNWFGKLTTAFQMLTLIGVLLEWPKTYLVWNLAGGMSIISCLAYILREMKSLKS